MGGYPRTGTEGVLVRGGRVGAPLVQTGQPRTGPGSPALCKSRKMISPATARTRSGRSTSRAGFAAPRSRLQAAEFFYEVSHFLDIAYTFKHALTHEVAYGSVLQERRRTLHCRILIAVETVFRDRLAEHVERLGYHAYQGQRWGKAVTYVWQAGVKAQKRSTNREAVAQFQQAIETLRHLPPERTTIEQA